MTVRALSTRVGDLRQIASVRQIVLNDGPEIGVRALLFSTGGGLDFMVIVDRSLDIGTVNYRGAPVAWQSAAGFRSPFLTRPEDDFGRGFNRAFCGFMQTCGLDHIRQPDGTSPLHGRLPQTPARLTAYGEDWETEEPTLFCEGEVTQYRYGGESFRLERRIEAPVGGTALRISDRVTNLGPEPWTHDLLYHFNLGYPAIQAGTRVEINDKPILAPIPALPGELSRAAECYRSGPTERAECRLTTGDGRDAFSLAVAFATDSLPFVQLWSDLRPHVGVLAIEPCTSDRNNNGSSVTLNELSSRASRSYQVDLSFTGIPPAIEFR